ncbi:MAG TPA: ACT domain-containing protein [Candidatus Dormibacteraeota bacterium]|nr:ACT domain-containing protein [Candidatus Dormibacteraeota bacterium]
MPRAKQLTVRVPDQPGMLGEVASALGEKKVNIMAIAAATGGGMGDIWLVVDKHAAAKKALAQRGWTVSEQELLAVTLPDNPGSLGKFAAKLGKAGVNLEYMYVGTAGSARKVNAYFGVSDMKKALKVRP